MFTLILFSLVAVINCNNNLDDELKVKDVVEELVMTLGIKETPNERIGELKYKLEKLGKFSIDRDKFNEILKNETKQTDLNETNFFNALIEENDFDFLRRNESKNLYLKLKEKMNRDDVKRLLSGGSTDNGRISARKLMGNDLVDSEADSDQIETVMDNIIAESPRDNHSFKIEDSDANNKYWDPQGELNDIQEYHRHDGRRIFKGERTSIACYPFMVSIHVMGRFWCGGVLYWHDLVLTSASCLQLMHNNRFYRENPRILQIRIGSNHSRIGGEMIDALEVYFHPGYNPYSLKCNIAIIRLRRHLHFSYHRTPKIIQISHSEAGVPDTGEVLLLGWGVTKLTQKMHFEPVFMQRKVLPIYPNKFCREIYGDKFVTSTMFCAGTVSTGEGACDHDAGGPAVMGGRLVGIISFGPAICGYPDTPTVFTLVGAFADWIETVNESMPLYYRGKAPTTSTTQANPYKLWAAMTWRPKLEGALSMEPYQTETAGLFQMTTMTATELTTTSTTTTTETTATETTTTAAPSGLLRLRDTDSDSGVKEGNGDPTEEGWSIERMNKH